jgi:integrase
MAARELSKRCECVEAKWSKCPHGWHFRKQVKGTRYQLSVDDWLGHTKCRAVADAERVRDQIVKAIRERTFSPLGPARLAGDTPPADAGEWTLRDVVAHYVRQHRDDPARSKTYVGVLQSRLRQVTEWALPDPSRSCTTLGDVPIGAITTELLETFYASLSGRDAANSTRNKHLRELRRLGRWVVKKGYRATPWLHSDDTELKRRKEVQRDRRLAPGEEERLIAAAGPLLQALIIAALECAARLGELLRVQWRDVDLTRGTMRFVDLKDEDHVTVVVRPISSRLRAVLDMRRTDPDGERLPPDAYVFGNEVGERVRSVLTAWETCVLKAHGHRVARDPKSHTLTAACRRVYGALNLKFHDLRHEAASRWLESGWPLHQIQAMLGHASLATTQVYLNVRAGDLTAQMAAWDAARAAAGDARKSGAEVVQSPPSGLWPLHHSTPAKHGKSKAH